MNSGNKSTEFQLQVTVVAGRENFGRTLVTVKKVSNGCILKKHCFSWMKLVVFHFKCFVSLIRWMCDVKVTGSHLLLAISSFQLTNI